MVARERNRRSGFTLFQLLAILALLAFLLGLILPSRPDPASGDAHGGDE